MVSAMNSTCAKFSSLANAKNYASRTIKVSVVILGDDELFWVVNMAVASKLIAAGYEIAK